MHECYNSEDQIWVRMHARHLLILYYLSASSPLVAPIVIYFYATLENLNRSLKSLKYFLQITFCSYHLALIVSVSLLVVQEAWKQVPLFLALCLAQRDSGLWMMMGVEWHTQETWALPINPLPWAMESLRETPWVGGGVGKGHLQRDISEIQLRDIWQSPLISEDPHSLAKLFMKESLRSISTTKK